MAQPAHAWWSDERRDDEAPDLDEPTAHAAVAAGAADAAVEVPGQVTLWDDAGPPANVAGTVGVPDASDAPAPPDTPAGKAARAEAARKAYAATSTDAAPGQRSTGAVGRAQPRKGVSLTGRGAVLCLFILTLLGGLADEAISGHRGGIFSVAFVLVATAAAWLVRRRDLAATVIAPPLVYCVVVAVISVAGSGSATGGLLTREGVTFSTSFITGTPWLWLGSAGAGAVAWWRSRQTATPAA